VGHAVRVATAASPNYTHGNRANQERNDPIYDLDQPAPSKEELAGAKQDAEQDLRLWKKRALYSTLAFFLSCASVIPFSKGHSLHAYAEPFGRILVYLSMALLLPFVACVGIATSSWSFLRNLKKGNL